MHSSLGTVNPIPGSELLSRLEFLHKLLRRQVGERDLIAHDLDVSTKYAIHGSMRKRYEDRLSLQVQRKKWEEESKEEEKEKDLQETDLRNVAASIIPLLHKLFALSIKLSQTPIYLKNSGRKKSTSQDSTSSTTSTASVTNTSSSSTPKRSSSSIQPPKQPPAVVIRITPPLTSKAIRHLWVKCLTLTYRLLPLQPPTILHSYIYYIGLHPRTANSSGGSRVASLQCLTSILNDEVLGPRYVKSLLGSGGGGGGASSSVNLLSLLHSGLKSSGATDVVHRIHCVQCAISLLTSARDCPSPYSQTKPSHAIFVTSNPALDDKQIMEALRMLRKAADDKFPEVRRTACELAMVLSSMCLLNVPPSGGDVGQAMSVLDELTQVCLRNVDDEMVGVGVGWSEALARCMCTAVEFHASLNDGMGGGNDNDTGDGVGPVKNASSSSSKGGNELSTKFKAFQESRKMMATIASVGCRSLESTLHFLVAHFCKVGGEWTASKLGGSCSAGGRNVRVGIGVAITEFCHLQAISGGIENGSSSSNANMSTISPSEVQKIIFQMVGSTLESQLDDTDASFTAPLSPKSNSLSPTSRESHTHRRHLDLDATSSPKRKTFVEKANVGFFVGIGGGNKPKSPADAGIARLTTNRVLRRGLAENMPEPVQIDLLRDLATICSNPSSTEWNRHQLQVALVEISHLVTALGDAATSSLDDLLPALRDCLVHSDHGIRHEAAVAIQAIAVVFPTAGRKYIMASVGEIQVHHDEILVLASSNKSKEPVRFDIDESLPSVDRSEENAASATVTPTKRRFRRQTGNQKQQAAIIPMSETLVKSLDHQYALHGHALLLSMILHVLPKLSGGLPSEILDIIVAVADSLTSSLSHEILRENHPGALCTCVRSGYCILNAVLTMGSDPLSNHLLKVFSLWDQSADYAEDATKFVDKMHHLSCFEPMLTSIVLFLSKSSEMLLSIPDALHRTSQVLEKMFPVIVGYQLGQADDNTVISSSRLDSAKASIMEAFSWLPPGSFPLMADNVFTFAARQIQIGTGNEIICSTLPNLVSGEDNMLDVRSICRAHDFGQVGGAISIEESVVAVTSECIHHSEREAVLHFLDEEWCSEAAMRKACASPIKKLPQNSQVLKNLPTVLHEVGEWKQPPSPSFSSKIRLMNAAIHVFAATFGMQDGHQQSKAINMLGGLILSQGHKQKSHVAATNVAASLLSCLKALPLHDGTNGSVVGMGPKWMGSAVKLLSLLLHFSESCVQRAAAEGLGLLASLGVTEDAHTIQSSILHSVEELLRGNIPDYMKTTSSNIHFEHNSTLKAGCLLALGCMQRAAQLMTKETARARSRFTSSRSDQVSYGSSAPTMIMLTRIIPYLATHASDDDSFLTRTYALHSFGLLLSYSKIMETDSTKPRERVQILSKAVEVVENNFFAAWKTNVTEIDNKGHEVRH